MANITSGAALYKALQKRRFVRRIYSNSPLLAIAAFQQFVFKQFCFKHSVKELPRLYYMPDNTVRKQLFSLIIFELCLKYRLNVIKAFPRNSNLYLTLEYLR